MSDGYSNIVLDHFEHPRNVGSLTRPDAFGYAENPVSGATLTLCLALDKGVVVEAMFQAQGCAATIASGSVLTELVVGKTPTQIRTLDRADIERALGGLPPTRKHAADLAIDAVREALTDFEGR
ncbi:MAG: iron-sulfur cluster assembly scaffold protein [Candidatus Latescibacteria bacterium]|jgi:nitrogen fixation NifU-like protein|nr:iron-sulfur cluster assembly scaffold protein [Candidatus Latescibacterota bacterium]